MKVHHNVVRAALAWIRSDIALVTHRMPCFLTDLVDQCAQRIAWGDRYVQRRDLHKQPRGLLERRTRAVDEGNPNRNTSISAHAVEVGDQQAGEQAEHAQRVSTRGRL